MMMLLCAFLLVSLCVSAAVSEPESLMMNTNMTYIKLMPMGSFVVSKQANISADTNKLKAALKMMVQVNADGSVDRTEDLSGLVLTDTIKPAIVDAATAGATALRVTTTANNTINMGSLKIIIDIYTESKTITRGTDSVEKTEIMAGDVGVTAKLTGYAFTAATNKLKMTIMLKGSLATPTEITTNKGTDGLAYNLGENGVGKLSKKFTLNNGSPLVDGNITVTGDMFTFEMAKGTDLEFRFFMTPADVEVDDDDDDTSSATSVTNYIGLTMITMVLVLLHTQY